MYRKQYSVKYRAAPYSARSASRPYAPQRASYSGLGAYRKRRNLAPPKRYAKRLGAYYIKGDVSGTAKIPGFGKIKGGLAAGYSNTASGLGAYNISNIKHNVLIKPDIPEVRNAIYAEGGTIIRHREYLGPITTSATAGAFKIQTYPLNPAQESTFPWLSTIAQNYEEYKPHGLLFEFRSTASDAIASSTNLALGQIMMCTQYDPTDTTFSSDIELLNYTWAQSGKVSDNVQHYVECDPNQSPLSNLYTRAGALATNTDLRFSDFGTFSIASSGLQGTSVQVGQLWVTYEFILYKPKIGSLSGSAGGWFHWGNDVGISTVNPFGTVSSGVVDRENNLNLSITDEGNEGQIRFPAYASSVSFMVCCVWKGASTASVSTPLIDSSADPLVYFIQHNGGNLNASVFQPATAITTTTVSTMCWVTIPGDGVSHVLQFGVGVLPTTPYVDIYVCQIPYLDPAIYG